MSRKLSPENNSRSWALAWPWTRNQGNTWAWGRYWDTARTGERQHLQRVLAGPGGTEALLAAVAGPKRGHSRGGAYRRPCYRGVRK